MTRYPCTARAALILLILSCFAGCGQEAVVRPLPDTPAEWVAEVRARYGLPALSAAIIRPGSIEVFQDGVRRINRPGAVQPGDPFHLGGNVKAMTATVIASLVEDSVLTWETTVLEAFPELDGIILSIYGNVTVEQCLTHRSGVAEFATFQDFLHLPVTTGTPVQQREQFTEWLLSRPAVVVPGRYAHSNAGFTVAAAIAERKAGIPWEELLRSRLFAPLSLTGSTGWPAAADSTLPWGHTEISGQLIPHIPSGGYVVPFLLSPALDIHMSTADWARFVQVHLDGLRGNGSGLLDPASFARIHEAREGVAMGWAVFTSGNVVTSTHEGSAGTFHSVAVLQASRGIAIVVVTNAVTLHSSDALTEAASGLLIFAGGEAAPGYHGR